MLSWALFQSFTLRTYLDSVCWYRLSSDAPPCVVLLLLIQNMLHVPSMHVANYVSISLNGTIEESCAPLQWVYLSLPLNAAAAARKKEEMHLVYLIIIVMIFVVQGRGEWGQGYNVMVSHSIHCRLKDLHYTSSSGIYHTPVYRPSPATKEKTLPHNYK